MDNDPLKKKQQDWHAFNAKKRKKAPVQKNVHEGSEKKKTKFESEVNTSYASQDAVGFEKANSGKGGALTNLLGTSRNQFHEKGLPRSVKDFQEKLKQFIDEFDQGDLATKQNALMHLGDMIKWLRDAKKPHSMNSHQTHLMQEKGVNRKKLQEIADFMVEKGLDLDDATTHGNAVRHFYPESNRSAETLRQNAVSRIDELKNFFNISENDVKKSDTILLSEARKERTAGTLGLYAYLGEMKDLYKEGKALYDSLGLGPEKVVLPVTTSTPYNVTPTISTPEKPQTPYPHGPYSSKPSGPYPMPYPMPYPQPYGSVPYMSYPSGPSPMPYPQPYGSGPYTSNPSGPSPMPYPQSYGSGLYPSNPSGRSPMPYQPYGSGPPLSKPSGQPNIPSTTLNQKPTPQPLNNNTPQNTFGRSSLQGWQAMPTRQEVKSRTTGQLLQNPTGPQGTSVTPTTSQPLNSSQTNNHLTGGTQSNPNNQTPLGAQKPQTTQKPSTTNEDQSKSSVFRPF